MEEFLRLAEKIRNNISILKRDGGNVADCEKKVNELETDFAKEPGFEILTTLRQLNLNIIKKNLENLQEHGVPSVERDQHELIPWQRRKQPGYVPARFVQVK